MMTLMKVNIETCNGGIEMAGKRYVVILNGSGGQGKSTFAEYCNKIWKSYDSCHHGYEFSTIDWPKAVAKFCGWNHGKSEKDRKFLSDLKIALSEWDNSPSIKVVENIFNAIKTEGQNEHYLFFVNCREPENIDNFKQIVNLIFKWPVCTVLVKNPNIKDITSNMADAGVYNYNYDYVIENNGDLNHLKDEAVKFVEKIIQECEE